MSKNVLGSVFLTDLETMKKSMKKADSRLAEARKYVASYKPTPKREPEPMPELEPFKVMPNPKAVRVENAEIMKLQKGYFFVVVTCNGKRHEIKKRFKSTTAAQKWILEHEYIQL